MMVIGCVCWWAAETGGQTLRLTQPNAEFGYTVLQMRQQQVLENFIKLVHVVNLDEYEQVLSYLEDTVGVIKIKIETWDVGFLKTGISTAREKN